MKSRITQIIEMFFLGHLLSCRISSHDRPIICYYKKQKNRPALLIIDECLEALVDHLVERETVTENERERWRESDR